MLNYQRVQFHFPIGFPCPWPPRASNTPIAWTPHAWPSWLRGSGIKARWGSPGRMAYMVCIWCVYIIIISYIYIIIYYIYIYYIYGLYPAIGWYLYIYAYISTFTALFILFRLVNSYNLFRPMVDIGGKDDDLLLLILVIRVGWYTEIGNNNRNMDLGWSTNEVCPNLWQDYSENWSQSWNLELSMIFLDIGWYRLTTIKNESIILDQVVMFWAFFCLAVVAEYCRVPSKSLTDDRLAGRYFRWLGTKIYDPKKWDGWTSESRLLWTF